MAKPSPDARASENVSLHGIDPEAALRALLAVDPEAEPVSGNDGDQGDDEDD